MGERLFCPKCRKTIGEDNFYTLKTGKRSDMCKACETMHINNWEPDTFLWLLEKYDVPYVPAEWNILRDRQYQKDPYKMTGMSVFGRYLSKMKLKQWKDFGWADTEKLQLEAEAKAALYGQGPKQDAGFTPEKIKEIQEQYEQGLISEAQYLTYAEAATPNLDDAPYESSFSGNPDKDFMPVNENPFEKVDIPDVGADLTDDDKKYLAMKWGVLYSAADWVSLEQLYEDFFKSFNIETAAHIDQLKFICKTSLKANQALDSGDIDTYQKLMKVYDSQMKAGKFTEAQNKEDKAQDFDSTGQIVLLAESKKGGGKIKRYKIDTPLDIVDETIVKLKNYYTDLIKNDSSLGQQLENFIKKKEIAEAMKRDREEAKLKGEDFSLSDEDLADFKEHEIQLKEEDEEAINELLNQLEEE